MIIGYQLQAEISHSSMAIIFCASKLSNQNKLFIW